MSVPFPIKLMTPLRAPYLLPLPAVTLTQCVPFARTALTDLPHVWLWLTVTLAQCVPFARTALTDLPHVWLWLTVTLAQCVPFARTARTDLTHVWLWLTVTLAQCVPFVRTARTDLTHVWLWLTEPLATCLPFARTLVPTLRHSDSDFVTDLTTLRYSDSDFDSILTNLRHAQSDFGLTTLRHSDSDLTTLRHSDSDSDLTTLRHSDSDSDLTTIRHSDSDSDFTTLRHSDSDSDLTTRRHSDSDTGLTTLIYSDSDSDLTTLSHSDSALTTLSHSDSALTTFGHFDSNTGLTTLRHSDPDTGLTTLRHSDVVSGLTTLRHSDSDSDLTTLRHSDSDLTTLRHSDCDSDLTTLRHSDSDTGLTPLRHSDYDFVSVLTTHRHSDSDTGLTPLRHSDCDSDLTPLRHSDSDTGLTPLRHSDSDTGLTPLRHSDSDTGLPTLRHSDSNTGLPTLSPVWLWLSGPVVPSLTSVLSSLKPGALMTLPVPSGSKPLPRGSPTTLITSPRPLLLLGRAIPGARQLPRGSPTTTTLITTLKTLLLLGIAATLSPTSEAMDHLLQVMPRVLVLTKKAPVGKVVVTCRQLPSSPSNPPVSLTLLRQAKDGDGHADTLADVSKGGPVVYTLDKGDSKFYTATGQRDTYLQLVMSRASCHESTYNYICKSRLFRSNQTSVLTFAAMAELPRPILKAKSTQEVYTDSQNLTLTCEINSPIGLVTNHAQGQWMWEYNDVGPWKPAAQSNISTLQATTDGCFQSSGFTRLKVRVKDLAHCWRLFRCYTWTPVSRAADNAAEFMVYRGMDCEKSSIQGAKPAVAILTVLLVITFLTALVTYLFRTSSRLRITFNEEQKQSMGTMLLSPMSDQQRNRLVKEQMHQHHVRTTPATYGVLKRTVSPSSDRLADKASFEVAMRKMPSPLPLKSVLKTSPARTTSPANNTDSMQPLLATEDSSFSSSVFDSSTYVSSYESVTTSEAPSEATSEATSDAQP